MSEGNNGTMKIPSKVVRMLSQEPISATLPPVRQSPLMNMLYRLVSPPELRQDWGDEQRTDQVDWWELFLDLVFVGAFFQLSAFVLKSDAEFVNPGFSDYAKLVGLVLYYTIILSHLWGDTCVFFTRFRVYGDFYSSLALAVYMGAIACAVTFIAKGLDDRVPFAISLVANRIGLILVYAPVAFLSYSDRPKPLARMMMTTSVVQAVAWLICAVLPESTFTTIVFVFNATGLWFLSRLMPRISKTTLLPLNIAHMAERLGHYVQMYLGEIVISIMDVKVGVQGVGSVSLAFLAVFMLKLLYFDCQPQDINEHAMKHKL